MFYRSTQLRSLAAVDTDFNQLAAEARAAIIELGPEHKNIAISSSPSPTTDFASPHLLSGVI